ncbi:MAG TPA: sigma-54 dependent transcriptional regulator [Terriglobales bacterium]|nr:sigma-54 dependent transcriptional regulator [Terriglobales bacterium]
MKENTANSVLVVDDEPGMRIALTGSFQREGWRVETASGAFEALRKFQTTPFPLVITDVRMPDGDGLQLLRSVRSANPATAVIVLTAFASVPEAVQAIQGGACDYLTKPISFEQLRSSVARVMQQATSMPADFKPPSAAILGSAPALLKALDRARHVAKTNADCLIEAESGTGKELLARFIHHHSARHQGSFVAVNCAAVPEDLLESELFGHMRGAFTGATAAKAGKFELAQGGTLLLDEIGEMPMNLQPKLLRTLQERQVERLGGVRPTAVNLRVIATTNVSLEDMVEQGRFRTDLYYRLNVIPLTLPPLRERPEDIPELAEHFARKFAAEANRAVPVLQAEFTAGLKQHRWPGNVRELANFLHRIVALNDSREIGPEHLTAELFGSAQARPLRWVAPASLHAGTSMRELERRLLETTLDNTGGNRTRAAEMLGVSLRTIRNKIREYGLPPRRYA